MAIKIIKKGKKELIKPIYKATCYKCKCEYTYSTEDLNDDFREPQAGSWTFCPECESSIHHNPDNLYTK